MTTYRINWTDRTGYYTEIDADSPEEALEYFNDGLDGDGIEPDGFAESEPGSIEIAPLDSNGEPMDPIPQPRTFAALLSLLCLHCPEGTMGEDLDGQLVFYTGLKETTDRNVEAFKPEDEDENP